VLLTTTPVIAQEADPKFYFLTFWPGENWDYNIGFDHQLGIRDHKRYIQKLFDDNIILMGGPIADEPGSIMLVRVDSFEQAQSIVDNDPGVVNKILRGTIVGWHLEMSSMRQFKRQKQEIESHDQPFRIESLDPTAPINIREQ
jgi:uncharacterized protein YciI